MTVTDPTAALRTALEAVAYVRARVAAEPTLAWPGEIDDILDDAALASQADDPSEPDVERLRYLIENSSGIWNERQEMLAALATIEAAIRAEK